MNSCCFAILNIVANKIFLSLHATRIHDIISHWYSGKYYNSSLHSTVPKNKRSVRRRRRKLRRRRQRRKRPRLPKRPRSKHKSCVMPNPHWNRWRRRRLKMRLLRRVLWLRWRSWMLKLPRLEKSWQSWRSKQHFPFGCKAERMGRQLLHLYGKQLWVLMRAER